MSVAVGLALATLSVTGFAATFIFGEAVTTLQWLGTAFVVASAVVETHR